MIYKIPDREMAKLIIDSNAIEGFYNVKADMDYMRAWVFLRGCRELSHLIIQRVQQMICNHQREMHRMHKGQYRRTSAFVGNVVLPDPALVRPLMEDFLQDVAKGEKSPMELHVQFEKIHPFVDGNGRTGRLLLWYLESRRNMKPTDIPVEFKETYYELFR